MSETSRELRAKARQQIEREVNSAQDRLCGGKPPPYDHAIALGLYLVARAVLLVVEEISQKQVNFMP